MEYNVCYPVLQPLRRVDISSFASYYWGGAGGTGYGEPAGNGGRGGGGAGGDSTAVALGDTFGIYPGGNGGIYTAGAGGRCTGGSGGSGSTSHTGGSGGSGIVVLAFPALGSRLPVTITNANFSTPDISKTTSTNIINSATTNSSTLTGWTCTLSSSNSSIDILDGSVNSFGISSTTVGYQNIMFSFSSSAVTNCTATISQSITFPSADTYKLIYYAIQRPGVATSTLTATINSTSSNASNFYTTSTWIAQSLSFTIATAGNYTLTLTATNGTTGTATSVGISYLSIL